MCAIYIYIYEHVGKMMDTRKQKAEEASEMPIKHSLFVGACRSECSFSGFSLFLVLEMRTILFSVLLPFVSFCCMHLYFMFTAVSYQMFFH